MNPYGWLIATLFLPLFPLGMVFNLLFQRVRVNWIRALLLLVWPLPGVWLLQHPAIEVPDWLMFWALFSALLYGFRVVVVRELGVWTGFLASSCWALAWVALAAGVAAQQLLWHVLAFSLPLALLVLLCSEVERRYESAYAGIVCGLAQSQPRLAGVIVITLLAVIGSPLFPGFFAMLSSITHAANALPLAALGLVAVWLLWSWSGMRLMQAFLVGPGPVTSHADIAPMATTVYSLLLTILVVGGLYLMGMLL